MVASLYYNFTQYINAQVNGASYSITKEIGEGYADERDIIIKLIPEIRPTITKTELIKLLKLKYSNEPVNVLEDHVQWRFFHFSFNKNNVLSNVWLGS